MFGAVRARIRNGPIHRGKSSDVTAVACAPPGRVDSEQHLVLQSELHVSPGGVELRLAPVSVLPLLQQGLHFSSHAPHQVSSSLAASPDPAGSGAAAAQRRSGPSGAEVLAAVGVRVGPRRDKQSLIANCR